jgi:beta-lactam-binding protein with PASTA domain
MDEQKKDRKGLQKKSDTLRKGRSSFDFDEGDLPQEEKETDLMTLAITIMAFAIGAAVLILAVLFFINPLRKGGGEDAGTVSESRTGQVEDSVTVPDLSGKTEAEAEELLKKLGLGMKYSGEQPSNKDEGVILSQNPEAGTKTDAHTTVSYVRSSGPEDLKMPDTEGMTLLEARMLLQNKGFEEISLAFKRAGGTVGKILIQSPAEGGRVHTTDPVTLTVSLGEKSRTAYVGTYIGLRPDQAANEAAFRGLICDAVYGRSDLVDAGMVMAQDAEPGSQVASGTLVTLTVNEQAVGEEECETAGTIRLGQPDNYTGGPVTLALFQEKQGKEYQILQSKQDSLTFPYDLTLKKLRGISEGRLWIYEETNEGQVRRASWKID